MKKYFVKCLPYWWQQSARGDAEFMIYKGESYRHIPELCKKDHELYTFIQQDGAERGYHEKWEDLTPARYFLCSKEVCIDDEFYSQDGVLRNQATTINHGYIYNGGAIRFDQDKCFKIIGMISNETTWLKEGDQLDEDEVKKINVPEWVKELLKLGHERYKIKGPCGHFH